MTSGGNLWISAGSANVGIGYQAKYAMVPLEIYDSRDDDGGMSDVKTDEYREGRIFDDVDLIS